MTKVFSTDHEKWVVRMSVNRKIKKSVRKPAEWKVLIRTQNSTTERKQQSEDWYQELTSFIAQSKQIVDGEARRTADVVEKWQQDTCAKFDVIEQYIIRMHNLQNVPNHEYEPERSVEVEQQVEQEIVQTTTEQTNHQIEPTEGQTDQQNEQPNTVGYPSMPELFEEIQGSVNLKTTIAPPSPVLSLSPQKVLASIPKRVERRRSTICVAPQRSPAEAETSGFSIRKKSFQAHSSILAMSKTPLKLVDNSEAQVSSTVADDKQTIGKRLMSNGKRKSNAAIEPEKLSVFRRFLQTRENRLDIKQLVPNERSSEKMDLDLAHAYPNPTI